MKKFYKFLKALCLAGDIFILLLLAAVICNIIHSEQYDDLPRTVALFVFAAAFIAFVEIILLRYYGGVVTDVSFSDGEAVIITNRKKYVLPVKYFNRVWEDGSAYRTYIEYDDGKFKKQFIYQMKYSPFKTHRLNLKEMKENMPYTEFS